MPLPDPTPIYHFTHVDHVETIVRDGLVSDTAARTSGLLQVEVGNVDIEERRRLRAVPIPPGGVVADYVPFYFAPRSPMMYVIHRGGVPTYRDGCGELVYLVSSVQRIRALELPWLCTDRNAVLRYAEFSADEDEIAQFVDWPLMRATMWANTDTDLDRKERRMAECLVHSVVPWSAIVGVATRSQEVAARARGTLARLGETRIRVDVRRDMYF